MLLKQAAVFAAPLGTPNRLQVAVAFHALDEATKLFQRHSGLLAEVRTTLCNRVVALCVCVCGVGVTPVCWPNNQVAKALKSAVYLDEDESQPLSDAVMNVPGEAKRQFAGVVIPVCVCM